MHKASSPVANNKNKYSLELALLQDSSLYAFNQKSSAISRSSAFSYYLCIPAPSRANISQHGNTPADVGFDSNRGISCSCVIKH